MTRLGLYAVIMAVLIAPLSAHAAKTEAEKPPALLQADNFTYDQQADIFKAVGKVELEQDGQILYADTLTYNRPKDTVTADGNVVIVDKDGQTYFAKHVELQQELKTGTVQQIGIVFEDGSRAAARYGEQKANNTTVMHDAVYSPCHLCEDDPHKAPLWQLRANKVVHDRNDKDIYYHGAKLDVYGKPIIYMPYFSHPDPSVRARSGFMTPQFTNDTKRGATLQNYYYYNISPQEDATIELTATQKAGPVLGTEWRKNTDRGNLFINTSINRSAVRGGSDDDTIIKEEDFRGHFFSNGQLALTPKVMANYSVRRVTDNYYLRDFGYGAEDILSNSANVEYYNGRNYGVVTGYYFQDLRPNIAAEQPDILPWVKYNMMGRPNDVFGGRWAMDTQTVTLFRDSQQSVSKLSVVPSWERRDILPGGIQSKLSSKVRADGYWIRQPSPFDVPTSTSNIDKTVGRLFPSAQSTVSYPLVRQDKTVDLLVEPKLALTVAPNTSSNNIPNEDSRDVEINISNLFDDSHFAGTDRIETGSHMSYGVKMGGYHKNGNSAFATVGQSYRFSNNNPFPNGSGLENDRSDLVGQLETTFYDQFYTDYRFQLNEQNLKNRKHELQALWIEDENFEIRTNYIFAEDVSGTGLGTNRQQWGLSGAKSLSPKWTMAADMLNDLSGDAGLLKSGLALQYKNECIRAVLRAERDLTDRSTGGSGSLIYFGIGLRNLGNYDAPLLPNDPLYTPFGASRGM